MTIGRYFFHAGLSTPEAREHSDQNWSAMLAGLTKLLEQGSG